MGHGRVILGVAEVLRKTTGSTTVNGVPSYLNRRAHSAHLARGLSGRLGEVLLKEMIELVLLGVHAAFAAVFRTEDALQTRRSRFRYVMTKSPHNIRC